MDRTGAEHDAEGVFAGLGSGRDSRAGVPPAQRHPQRAPARPAGRWQPAVRLFGGLLPHSPRLLQAPAARDQGQDGGATMMLRLTRWHTDNKIPVWVNTDRIELMGVEE